MKLTKKTILIIGIVVLVLFLITGTLYFLTRHKKTKGPVPVSLTYWGVFDTKEMVQPIIDAYTKAHPNVTITYTQKPIDGYDQALKDAFAAGNGPDIFQIHNTDVTRYQLFIQPLAPEKVSLINDYFDVVEKDAVQNGQIYGLPYSVDSLALYYNKRMFEKAGITNPPRTWDDFNTAVQKLSKLDASGNFIQSGAAIGGSSATINRAPDILSLIWLQSGTPVVNQSKDTIALELTSNNTAGVAVEHPGLTGLNQYLQYAKPLSPLYTWNENQDYSFDEFAQEKVGMVFSYAYALPTIRSKNPKMQLGIVPAPQITNSNVNTTFANYWLNVPAKEGSDPATAWDFITFATNTENDKLYSSLANKPVSRRDLVNTELNDADLGTFAEQNLYATSWYQFDVNQYDFILNTMLTEALSGKKIVEKAYGDMIIKLQDLVSQGRALKEKIANDIAAAKAEQEKQKAQNTTKK